MIVSDEGCSVMQKMNSRINPELEVVVRSSHVTLDSAACDHIVKHFSLNSPQARWGRHDVTPFAGTVEPVPSQSLTDKLSFHSFRSNLQVCHTLHHSLNHIHTIMRFFVLTLLVALLAAFVSASLPQKAVIVSFPNETPDYIVLEAKEGLRAAVRV